MSSQIHLSSSPTSVVHRQLAQSDIITLEVLQAIHYLRSNARHRDSVFIKLAVGVNLVADLIGIMACSATTYFYVVKYWICGFLPSHYWQITKNHVVFAVLPVVLAAAVTGVFASGVVTALQQNPQQLVILNFLALSGTAAGNVLISVEDDLRVDRNGEYHNSRDGHHCCDRVRATMLWIAFAFIQARIYSCTMLFVLQQRLESASALTGTAVESAHTDKENCDSAMMFASVLGNLSVRFDSHLDSHGQHATVVEHENVSQLMEKKMELHRRDFDSDLSSDVNRNPSEELRETEEDGSPRASSSSAGERSNISSVAL
ncbi:hypothetical protein C8R44DRAFT_982695 [Mycena epipterygia]|nr:hypothetical protein C8R44DRAFT_982695 [Mycena epipterygia]